MKQRLIEIGQGALAGILIASAFVVIVTAWPVPV